jgi:hypothetical protein
MVLWFELWACTGEAGTWNMTPALFCLVIFEIGFQFLLKVAQIQFFYFRLPARWQACSILPCWDGGLAWHGVSPSISLLRSLDDRCVPPPPAICWDGFCKLFLLRLASIHDPPDLSLQGSYDYKYEPLVPDLTLLLKAF